MIEKFNKEELNLIIKELAECGMTNSTWNKVTLLRKEAAKIGYDHLFISRDLSKDIYDIADIITDNFKYKKSKRGDIRCKTNAVPREIEDKYCEILANLLGALTPYIGVEALRISE